MPSEKPAGAHRLEYLDSIRGLAALSVVCSHYVLAFGLPAGSESLRYWLTFSPLHVWWDGFAAVSLFFVLSGFVLSLKYFLEPHGSFDFLSYAVARVCRIWLPYAACFVLSLAMYAVSVTPSTMPPILPWFSEFWRSLPSLPAALAELALVVPVPTYTMVPQAWTLSIELVLSLFVPLAIFLALRRVSILVLVSLVAVVVLKFPMYWVHFVMGILLAKYYLAWRSVRSTFWQRGALLATGLFLYTFRFTLPVYLPGIIAENRIFYVTGLGAALLLLFVMQSEGTQKVLQFRPLRLLGRCSYGIYLLHFAVLLCLSPRLIYLLNWMGVWDPRAAWMGGFAGTIMITILASLPFYRVVEMPSIALGRVLGRRMTRRIYSETN